MGQASAPQGAPQGGTDRLLTLPNLLSLLRLLLVPVFLYLVLGPHADGWAFLILVFSGVSDYLDGKLARALNQVSQLGAVLDPLADRLYIVSTIIAFGVRGIVPWWFVAVLVLRDLALLGFIPVLDRLGYKTLPVHFLGKAGTFTLLYAFPLLLLSTWDNWVGTVARPAGWAFAIWGLALYWWAGALYVYQVRLLWREQKAEKAAGPAGPAGPARRTEQARPQGSQREART
ncbi:MAG: CDP-alcohol phosphatidyltransferase family protein [Frankiaceae bacterium]